jgi:hypothetical protein
MSMIEALAMPFAIPLIRGEPQLLTPFGQYAVAALISLIAMRLEFLGTMRAVSQAERDWLRRRYIPSTHWKI